jgi:predicted nuclease of predicted toxin-antitoxin system
MKLLVDMNLPPRWVEFLATKGIEAMHWSTVGDPRATDAVIMQWASERSYAVFTHDLDFSARTSCAFSPITPTRSTRARSSPSTRSVRASGCFR